MAMAIVQDLLNNIKVIMEMAFYQKSLILRGICPIFIDDFRVLIKYDHFINLYVSFDLYDNAGAMIILKALLNNVPTLS